jgi:hypothetical protein
MQQNAFNPIGSGIAVTPTAVNQTVLLPAPVGLSTGTQVHCVNLSTQAIFITFAGAAVATVPVVGTAGTGFCIPAGAAETLTPPMGATSVGVIQATAGSGFAYFYQGEGI